MPLFEVYRRIFATALLLAGAILFSYAGSGCGPQETANGSATGVEPNSGPANGFRLVSLCPAGTSFAVAAVGRHQRPMTELAMRLGGHARVGLEDNIYLERGTLSQGSAPLVQRARRYGEALGRVVVEPARARELLLETS